MKEYKFLESVKGKNWDKIWQLMFKQDMLKDITFLFDDDGNVVTLKAHKLFLSLRSPVFHCMFYGSLATSASSGQEIKEIAIFDIESNVFSILLRFIYNFNDLSKVNVGDIRGLERAKLMIDILYAAKKYMLEDIEEILITHINSNINYFNAHYYLMHSKLYNGIDQGVCCKVLAHNWSQFSKTTSFLEMTREDLLAFLLDDNTDVVEVNLVKATLAWAKHNASEPSTDLLAAGQIRATLGEDIIKAIRYPLLEATDFHQLIVRPAILHPEEINEILLKILGIADARGNTFCARPRFMNISRPYIFGDLVEADRCTSSLPSRHKFCFSKPTTVIIEGLCLIKSFKSRDVVTIMIKSRNETFIKECKLRLNLLSKDTKYDETYFEEPLILNIDEKDTDITILTLFGSSSRYMIERFNPIELGSYTITLTSSIKNPSICGLII